MYDDGNFHDADISLTPDHIKSLSHYQAPTLAYHPYHGPFITQQLINATKAGDYQRVLEIFKETRVDPNHVDEYGNSALHYAHAIGHAQLICLLGTHHSDFSLENNKGQTPYDMFEEAADNAEDAVLKTLLENTAEEIILANYRFTEHSGHDFWEPGAKFESADSENWDPTTGRYLHHIPGQPVGVQEPDKLDL